MVNRMPPSTCFDHHGGDGSAIPGIQRHVILVEETEGHGVELLDTEHEPQSNHSFLHAAQLLYLYVSPWVPD